MRVLVCGDRNWLDVLFLHGQLSVFHSQHKITRIIEGEAKGADRAAALWALRNNIPVDKFPANWALYGRAAGAIRNAAMLELGKPQYVLAFHDYYHMSKGTKDMLNRAAKAKIPARLISHESPLGVS